MAIILKLEDHRSENPPEKEDLTSLLKRISQVKNLNSSANKETISDPFLFFQGKISEIIIGQSLVEQELLLCGMYVAKLLANTISQIPPSWWAVDYIMEGHSKDKPYIIQQGADVCFLICSIFKERAEVRVMTMSDYQRMGPTLFHQFYNKTGSEIGYHMSRNFERMVLITDECFQSL